MFNRQVTRHSYGRKEADELYMLTESVAANQVLDRMVTLEHNEKINREVEVIEKQNQEKAARSTVAEHTLLESQLPYIMNDLRLKGREVILNDILFETYNASLWIDEEEKVKEEESFRYLIESFVANNGGFALIENAYKRTKSPILKEMINVCESTANKVCTRKIKEVTSGAAAIADINFDLNDDEKDALDYDKKNLNIDQISDLVKSKVITVIEDEKSRQAKEEELQNDLAAQADADGTTVEEAFTHYVITESTVGVEEGTLFNALFRKTFKMVLESQAIIHSNDGNAESDDFVNTTNGDVTEDEYRPYTLKDDREGEYNIKSERNEYDNDEEVSLDDEAFRLDMDLVLAEATAKYTLLEMAHTLKLEEYNFQALEKMTQNLLN